MLRITCTQGPDSVLTLSLEGKLLGPWVTELARSCDELSCPPNRQRLAGPLVASPDALEKSDVVRGTPVPVLGAG